MLQTVKWAEKAVTGPGTAHAIDLQAVPKEGPGGISYLRKLVVEVDTAADFDTGANGATPLDVQNIVESVRLETPGVFGQFGPQNLTGPDLSALFAFLTGKRLPWQLTTDTTAGGDAAVAANTTGARKRFSLVIPFDAIGENPGDFSPMVYALARAGARLHVKFGAAAAAVVADYSATLRVHAIVDNRRELVAVPPVLFQRVGIDRKLGAVLGSGRLHALLFKSSTLFDRDNVTAMELKADGSPVVDSTTDPAMLAFLEGTGYGVAPSVLGVQSDFITSHADRRYVPIYPVTGEQGERISKVPYASSWTANITGDLTVANCEFVTVLSQRLTEADAIGQLESAGVFSRADLMKMIGANPGALGSKTASKSAFLRSALTGFLPVKLDVDLP